jgi:hypothetical protein
MPTPATIIRFLMKSSAFALMLTLGACAAKQQSVDVSTAGFLTDYSILEPGTEGQAQFRYRNPKADFSAYDRILFKRVHVWRQHDADLDPVPDEDMQRLADELYGVITAALAEDYKLVTKPAPGVMRIHMALTNVRQSNAALDVFTTLVEPEHVIQEVDRLAGGTQKFVGEAAVEIEIIDAATDEILVAVVDHRIGRESLEGTTSSWGDVHAAFEVWAQRISTFLAQARGGKA